MCLIAGTHDTSNLLALPRIGGFAILVDFEENSQATGVLLTCIFFNKDGSVNFSNSFVRALNRSELSNEHVLSSDLWHPGQYILYAYDIMASRRIMDETGYHSTNYSLNVTSGQGTEQIDG